MVIRLAIAGFAGRMGQRIYALARQDPAFRVVYGLEARGGLAPMDVPVGDDLEPLAQADVVIDFTVAEASGLLALEMAKLGKALVIGTTGIAAAQDKQIAEASRKIPVVKSSNMSQGVHLFFRLAEDAARALRGYSVHIHETHHAHKKDAPSGTALEAGRRIEKAGGQPVTYESVRTGEVVGDHRIIFKGPSDQIEIFHHAGSRDIFASGALQAAKWVIGKKPGLYSMADVLRL